MARPPCIPGEKVWSMASAQSSEAGSVESLPWMDETRGSAAWDATAVASAGFGLADLDGQGLPDRGPAGRSAHGAGVAQEHE